MLLSEQQQQINGELGAKQFFCFISSTLCFSQNQRDFRHLEQCFVPMEVQCKDNRNSSEGIVESRSRVEAGCTRKEQVP
jgi:hypothetical protein